MRDDPATPRRLVLRLVATSVACAEAAGTGPPEAAPPLQAGPGQRGDAGFPIEDEDGPNVIDASEEARGMLAPKQIPDGRWRYPDVSIERRIESRKLN